MHGENPSLMISPTINLRICGYKGTFPASCISWAYVSLTSLPCAQDTGGENLCIDTKGVLKLLIVGDSAVRLLVTLEARSAW